MRGNVPPAACVAPGMIKRAFGLAAALWLATSSIALADPVAIPSIPPEVQNNPIVQSVLNALGNVLLQSTNGPTAHGKVTYFRRYDLQVQTAPNVYREVHLHPGTVINPRGTTIVPGMTVDVNGSVQSDKSLSADTITTH
jgi:hypothetical protein